MNRGKPSSREVFYFGARENETQKNCLKKKNKQKKQLLYAAGTVIWLAAWLRSPTRLQSAPPT